MTRSPQPLLDDTRMDLLDEASRALQAAEESLGAVQAGADAAISSLADFAVVLAVNGNGGEDRLHVAHRDPEQADRVRELVRPLLPAVREAAMRDQAKGREFRWVSGVNDVSLRFLREQPELAELICALGIRSLIVVPLRSAGKMFGGMALCRTGQDPFHAADLVVAQALARRTATAIETSQLRERSREEQSRRVRLEALLQKWVRVFDLAGWGAAIVDGINQRIEAVNPAFARLHGYDDPLSLSGRRYTDLLPPDRNNEPAEWPAGGAENRPYESIHVRADGSLFPVLTDVTILAMGAVGTSFVVTIQDVTELKRTEERLRRAQRLEAVGRLAGGVAHEVNNMMTIILGFSDLLARAGRLPPERQGEVEEIRKAAARAGQITQQLLAFSRQQVLHPTNLELNNVVTHVAPMLRLLLPANIELETPLSPVRAAVQADRAQLEQVIINLAFNARDAMPEGGLLRISTGSRRLDEQDGRRLIGIPIPVGPYALISVVDTGHGMDSDTLMQVFEPFFTTKPVGSGTGLGLATVYGIVKQSGGYVWVESTPGRGTTVTVCLPQVDAQVPSGDNEKPTSGPARCRAGTVLVVEDEEGVRQLAQRVLEQQGHRVLEAQNGDAAVAVLREFGPDLDLVISDVIVPGIGTSELAREVRDRRPDLPILYMSGYSRDEMIERNLVSPERPFLQKPFTGDKLAELVCQELEARTRPVVGR
jgi:two-component system, cell cycle sensor histidine kinase and response regulator CckA